jgi:hypothetical protein
LHTATPPTTPQFAQLPQVVAVHVSSTTHVSPTAWWPATQVHVATPPGAAQVPSPEQETPAHASLPPASPPPAPAPLPVEPLVDAELVCAPELALLAWEEVVWDVAPPGPTESLFTPVISLHPLAAATPASADAPTKEHARRWREATISRAYKSCADRAEPGASARGPRPGASLPP